MKKAFLIASVNLNWILLAIVVCGISVQSISQKAYNTKINGGVFAFSAGSALFAGLFFVISSGGRLDFTTSTLLYSAFFAIAYATSIAGLFLAIRTGPLSFTSLISSYSLVIPTFYGIFILNEEPSVTFIIGLVLLLVSLALMNFKTADAERKINGKWIFFVFLAFLGNGMCTVIQKIQQDAFRGAFKSEFMICALAMVFIAFALVSVFAEGKQLAQSIKGSKWFAICGLFNGLVNLLVMILTGRMNVSIMFPFISAGGVLLTFVVSRLLYREKFSAKQNIGFALGVLAVIALNL